MKWFKSRKQKKIEELQFEIAQLKAKENQILLGFGDDIKKLSEQVKNIGFAQYPRVTVENLKTETLVVSFTVPRGVPMVTDDIEARMAALLGEKVAKYMIVQKDSFARDPLAGDVYRAMVKVVVYPVDERKFYGW